MARPARGITFWDRVWTQTRITDARCIEFTGCKDGCGYGRINRDNKLVRLHREVWKDANGEVPSGKEICHKCDNPSCINLNHLYAGTHKQNMADKALRGRVKNMIGSLSHRAKLHENDIPIIRSRISGGETCYSIARDYGVTGETVLHIKNGRSWGHVA